jgi:hypothetical protein
VKTILIVAAMLCFSAPASAQKSEIAEATFRISGNCGMCKKRIEKALSIREVKYAKWDKVTKMARVAYLSAAVSLDSLQHRVALAGHDTGKFRAPDDTYASLPECCLYRENSATH